MAGVGAVHAHWCYHDAVWEGEAAEGDGLEEGWGAGGDIVWDAGWRRWVRDFEGGGGCHSCGLRCEKLNIDMDTNWVCRSRT